VNAGMPRVVHVIDAPNVVDINVVVVVPAYWPSVIISEPVAVVLEAMIPVDKRGTAHVKRVAMTKIGTETVVRNATIMVAVVPTVVSSALSLLPSGLLRLLYALWLLLALLVLRLLCVLRPLCALHLLCVLWLLLALLVLHLLALHLLCMLRLLLVLGLLCFSSASALFVLSFLCECGNGGSEK